MNKVYLHKNVALLQINVKQGVDEYYLAKNTDWQGHKIDKIILFAPETSGMLSPIDGVTHVLTKADLNSLYFDLYDREDHTLCNGLAHSAILHSNNHPFIINSELQFNMSRMYFSDSPQTDGCVLLYVFYESREEYDFEMPQRSITISFPLAANEEITFTKLINTYVHAPANKVRGVTFWDADNNPAYVVLRDHQNTYVIDNLATPIMRPQMVGVDAEHSQIYPMLFDNIDIDFDNSFIRNATNSANVQTMTIKY